jgi:putative transposase
VGLKLIFLTVSSAMSLLRLPRREEWWKDAEILMLRHQLAVALRERPRAVAGLTRNLLMDLEDAGMSVKFVLHDRDASFTAVSGAVFQAAGVRVVRSAIQVPRMNSIMERWIGSCRRELLDRTLVWNQRHLMIVLREYEDFCNRHRPHRTLNQAAPLRPLPDGVTDLDQFRVQRRDRAGGVIHEYRLVA